ncbi:hypothetical protein ABZ079_28115 [Streptomyces sp. NPDC006314]|uniref:hypothetical protein n=1 Tax=Streptomyces sp. NPDC006314 TaxID=3154475 RepID=UPI0033A61702
MGTQVVVMTVDPRRHVDNRLGPPPGAPDHVALKPAAGVALGCVASSACCAGLFTEDMRRWLHRSEPVDRRPGGPAARRPGEDPAVVVKN